MTEQGVSSSTAICIGAGWIGTALASSLNATLVSRRQFHPSAILSGCTVYVASGRSAIPQRDRTSEALRSELRHLRDVLDACEDANARRVIVLGSSDVAGLTEVVRGTSAQSPVTGYGEVKAAIEDECVRRASQGLPITHVRLAPVHGPGKQRTATMVQLARRRFIPVPGSARHSIGFVFLVDALRAIEYLGRQPAPAVVAVGGGYTPLGELLQSLARVQGVNARLLSVPVPRPVLRSLASARVPDGLHWLLRYSLPKTVEMEVPVDITPLTKVAATLVASC